MNWNQWNEWLFIYKAYKCFHALEVKKMKRNKKYKCVWLLWSKFFVLFGGLFFMTIFNHTNQWFIQFYSQMEFPHVSNSTHSPTISNITKNMRPDRPESSKLINTHIIFFYQNTKNYKKTDSLLKLNKHYKKKSLLKK